VKNYRATFAGAPLSNFAPLSFSFPFPSPSLPLAIGFRARVPSSLHTSRHPSTLLSHSYEWRGEREEAFLHFEVIKPPGEKGEEKERGESDS